MFKLFPGKSPMQMRREAERGAHRNRPHSSPEPDEAAVR